MGLFVVVLALVYRALETAAIYPAVVLLAGLYEFLFSVIALSFVFYGIALIGTEQLLNRAFSAKNASDSEELEEFLD